MTSTLINELIAGLSPEERKVLLYYPLDGRDRSFGGERLACYFLPKWLAVHAESLATRGLLAPHPRVDRTHCCFSLTVKGAAILPALNEFAEAAAGLGCA